MSFIANPYRPRSDTHVKKGDIVNITGTFDEEGVCAVTDESNILVVHPDLLITGTAIVSCMNCMRRYYSIRRHDP